jgi:bacteriorhodopsin
MYLGFTLSLLLDVQWYKWEYYVIMVPTILLVQWKVNNKEEE